MQDDEYLASLQVDREKELKAREEAEAAFAEEKRKEEELRRKMEEEQVTALKIWKSAYGEHLSLSLIELCFITKFYVWVSIFLAKFVRLIVDHRS